MTHRCRKDTFYRWRRVFGGLGQHTAVTVVTPAVMADAFVDLGTLTPPSARMALRLDPGAYVAAP